MINNAKYGGKSILPELRVIESGILKGFVTISPKWAGFKAADYLQASMSVYTDDTYYGQPAEGDATFEVAAGDFDLRGFEVTNASLFDANKRPYVLFQSKQIKFSTNCVRQFGKDNKVELLIHPGLRKLAVRRASKDSRQFVQWSRPDEMCIRDSYNLVNLCYELLIILHCCFLLHRFPRGFHPSEFFQSWAAGSPLTAHLVSAACNSCKPSYSRH